MIAVRTFSKLTPLKSVNAALYHSAVFTTESYTEKQAKMNRPVSPHVEIYKFPPVALSSITTRVTGVILTAGLTGIGGMALVGHDPSVWMSTIGATNYLGEVVKFSVSFPLVYHYLSGLRHLLWNQKPELLTNDKVERSSIVLFGVAATAGIILAFQTIEKKEVVVG